MRNLKKFLALVLAMMMVMSLMVTVNAAEFKDLDTVSEDYYEAVAVLGALRVYRGKGGSSFDPTGELSRAELAAIVYRIITGDVDDDLIKQTQGYHDFDDVAENHWANGYINFVHNGNYMVGVGGGNFEPETKVNGFQVLATIMRAMGYDKEGEFRGSNWQTYTATQARALGLTTGLTTAQLNAVATRELVAELLFRAIKAPTVAYTALEGYQEQYWQPSENEDGKGTVVRDGLSAGLAGADLSELHPWSLGYQHFGLLNDPVEEAQDVFGRPGEIWVIDDDGDGTTEDEAEDLLADEGEDSLLVFVADRPKTVFEDEAVDGGMIYTAVKKTSTGAATYIDGAGNEGPEIEVDSGEYDEDQVVGGRGSVVEVYYGGNAGSGTYAIVVINTYVTTIADYVKAATNKDGVVTRKAFIQLTAANAGINDENGGLGEIDGPSDLTDEDSVPDEDHLDLFYTNDFTKDDIDKVVLYTIADGVVQTVELAESKTLTVGVTRNYDDINTVEGKSYFKAGSSTYYYSVMYGPTEITGEDIEDTADTGYYVGILAELADGLNGLGDKVIAYMDKYGHPILISVIPSASDETHAMVIYGADSVKVGSKVSTYVLDLDVILNNGSDRNVKAVFDEDFEEDLEGVDEFFTEPVDRTTVDAVAKAINEDLGSVLVEYYINEDGYYVIRGFGSDDEDAAGTPGNPNYEDADALIQGDANSIEGVDVDADTSFIVEERAARTGKISYKQYAGFKKVESYVDYGDGDTTDPGEEALQISYIITDDGLTVYARNAMKIEDGIEYDVPNYVYVYDTQPDEVYSEDDYSVTYWAYDVIQDGKLTTITTTNGMDTAITEPGLYKLETYGKKTSKIFTLTKAEDNADDELEHEFTLAKVTDNDSLAYGSVCQADVIYTDSDKLTVADKCTVWDLTGSTPKTADLDDLANGDDIVVLYDEEGYVVTIFIVTED